LKHSADRAVVALAKLLQIDATLPVARKITSSANAATMLISVQALRAKPG